MTHLPMTGGYRIGPIPRRPDPVRTQRRQMALALLAAFGLGLLVAYVVVLLQGVERGQQLRAAMSAAPAHLPARLAHTKPPPPQPAPLLAVASPR